MRENINFKTWLITEDVAFIKNLLQTHQVLYLGKMGLWNVYSAVASKKPLGKILTIPEYRSLKRHVEQNLVEDYFADMEKSVRFYCENAANALVKIGFPKYTTTMVFMNLKDRKNIITGGGVGGEAHWKQHAFTVERGDVNEGIIIHEHAHMWWDNVLPKYAKTAFRKWYDENVGQWIKKPEHFISYEGGTPARMKAQDIARQIDLPAGEKLRQAIAKQGIVPTSYAAANYDELWAVTVQKAALMTERHPRQSALGPPKVSRELRKLLYDILSGTVGFSVNPFKHFPRRMERRKDLKRSPHTN